MIFLINIGLTVTAPYFKMLNVAKESHVIPLNTVNFTRKCKQNIEVTEILTIAKFCL